VLDFQMNDAQGTRVANLQNDAGGGGFSYGATNMYTDGNGSLVYTNFGSAQNNYGNVAFTRTLTNETGRMSFSFSTVEMATETDAELTYSLKNSGGDKVLMAQLIVNGGQLKLIMDSWSNVADFGTLTMSTPLDVSIDFDLVNGTADYTWSYNGTSGGAANVAISGSDAASVTQAYQSADVTGNYFAVDYLKVEGVPEPATLGMVGAVAGAMLFIRRRFMI
jgi:hypothetical protein